jgi:quercetin dioxygenase-like cupin family protein
MGIAWNSPYEPMVGDPDDHRPQTVWRVVIDPDGADGSAVVGMAVLMERCAVGDRIPLHRHDVDEVVVVVEGTGIYHLDGADHAVAAGDVVFIPAGTTHGTVNAGELPLHVHAVFPSRRVRTEMLDRNPAPGTEDELPMTTVYDFATGEVVVIGPTGP